MKKQMAKCKKAGKTAVKGECAKLKALGILEN